MKVVADNHYWVLRINMKVIDSYAVIEKQKDDECLKDLPPLMFQNEDYTVMEQSFNILIKNLNFCFWLEMNNRFFIFLQCYYIEKLSDINKQVQIQ